MKKNKGFTLIELLAVIVILAVIALIATPIVLNLIESARKGAVVRSAEGLLKASNFYYASEQFNPDAIESISFNCDDSGCISTKVDENNNPIKLDLDGKVGTGDVNIDEDGKVSFKLVNNGYCVYKSATNDKINIAKGDCDSVNVVDDTIPPVISEIENSPITNSNSIIIGYTIVENESGLKPISCTYGTTAGTYDMSDNIVASASACKISGLSVGTYYYKVCATDQGMNTACIEGSATTNSIPMPTIEYKDASGNAVTATDSGYVSKDYITITYDDTGVSNASNYVRSSVGATAVLGSGGSLQVCGNGASPEETCTSAGTTLDANNWYKLMDTKTMTLEFTTEGEINAITFDDNGNTNGGSNASSRHIIPTAAQIGFDNTNVNSERNCDNVDCALSELEEKLNES